MNSKGVHDKNENRDLLRSLNQILAVGNLIHVIPVGAKLSEFLYSEMKSIHGVESCKICLYANKEPYGDIDLVPCDQCTFFENSLNCLHKSSSSIHVFPLSTIKAKYAFIILGVNSFFSDELLPAIQNLANITAISIENDHQSRALKESNEMLKTHRALLEQKVNERNVELEITNVQLLKTITILNQAQEVAHVGHWELDLIHDVLYWSDEVFKIFQIEKDKFTPNLKGFLENVYREDVANVKRQFEISIKNHTPYNIDHRIVSKSREIKYLQEIGRIEYTENDIPVRAIGMVLDVTERKMSEIMLLESEKKLQKQNEEYERLNNDLKVAVEKAEENDRLKTAFLHNISHEIRTPMNAIIGFSGILNDPGISRQKADSYLDIITKSGYQLLSIIDDIVKIATIEAGQVKINRDSFNLNSVFKLQYSQFSDKAREKEINFSYVTGLPDHDSEIITDKIKIEEILNNLIGNALKFTSKGSIKFGYQIKGGSIEFFVADTGIGIADSLHKEIFERFRQAEVNISREYGGSGLGLSISKSYVEILGGKIWLESQQGEGSVFYFTLPHVKVNPKDKSSYIFEPGEAIVLNGTKTILIAEDEDFNYLFLEEVLLKHKLKLMRAVNGKEAVEICEKHNSIDLVLMDIKMPVMDGYQATQKIKFLRPKLPVILQTAITEDSDLQKACENGCNDYIIKPIVKNELLRLLKKYL